MFLAILLCYCVIGIGVSFLVANYQNNLKVVPVLQTKSANIAIAELIVGNIVLILVWPLIVYAIFTWWKKEEVK